MKIVAPLNSAQEAEALLEAGADELYCGLCDESWKKKFSNVFSSNKRNHPEAQLPSFEELKEALEICKKKRKELTLVFNNFFVPACAKDIISMQKKAIDIGIKNFVVTDHRLLDILRSNGRKPILSCTTPIFNTLALEHYKDRGIKRVILSRDLSVGQIKRLTSGSDLEFETIIMNETCPNIDGFCRFYHGRKDDDDEEVVQIACSLAYQETKRTDEKKDSKITRTSNSCGACFLPDLEDAGITHLKISGRGWPTQKKIRDITMIRNAIQRDKGKYFRDATIKDHIRIYNAKGNCIRRWKKRS